MLSSPELFHFVQSTVIFCRADEFSGSFVISSLPHTSTVYFGKKINQSIASFAYHNQDVFNTDNLSGRSICFLLTDSRINIGTLVCPIEVVLRVFAVHSLFVVTFFVSIAMTKREKRNTEIWCHVLVPLLFIWAVYFSCLLAWWLFASRNKQEEKNGWDVLRHFETNKRRQNNCLGNDESTSQVELIIHKPQYRID